MLKGHVVDIIWMTIECIMVLININMRMMSIFGEQRNNSLCLVKGYIDGKYTAAYCVKSCTVAGYKSTKILGES